MSDRSATVIGAGLAGCEAAWQLAERGIHVRLIEMKPHKMSPAHHSEQFAELVCSNSFRGDRLTNAIGLLKEEMRILGSLIMRCADETKVPAGGALAVDRDSFSAHVTKAITGHPLIEQIHEEAVSIPDGPVIIATGPLTSDTFAEVIRNLPGMSTLNFYDAAAPIVFRESLDESKLFRLSRYNRGNDYLNAPMTEEEYTVFINELINAETAEIHGFEENRVFEGCMPIESMAKRGFMVPAFGPLKPVGLADPRTGKEPFAVVQLRQDNASDTMYNLVGFQTLNETDIPVFPSCTALGAMGKHVSTPNPNFQPMNCSFGLIDPLPVIPGEKRLKKKQDRYEAVAQRALSCIKSIQSQTGGK